MEYLQYAINNSGSLGSQLHYRKMAAIANNNYGETVFNLNGGHTCILAASDSYNDINEVPWHTAAKFLVGEERLMHT